MFIFEWKQTRNGNLSSLDPVNCGIRSYFLVDFELCVGLRWREVVELELHSWHVKTRLAFARRLKG